MASGYAKGFRSTVYKKTYLNGEKPPMKGSLSEKLKLTDIEAGDHIMVRHYESLNLKTEGHELYFHSFLIGEIEVDEPIRRKGRTFHSRSINIYDFKKGQSFKRKGTGNIFRYTVYATATEVDRDPNPMKWSYTQDDFAGKFQEYLNRAGGLIRYSHPQYERNSTTVIRRAEDACNMGDIRYHINKNNCEHFVNACKGLFEDGYGWSFQMNSKGSILYVDHSNEGSVPVQVAGPIQESSASEAETVSTDDEQIYATVTHNPEMDSEPVPQSMLNRMIEQPTEAEN